MDGSSGVVERLQAGERASSLVEDLQIGEGTADIDADTDEGADGHETPVMIVERLKEKAGCSAHQRGQPKHELVATAA